MYRAFRVFYFSLLQFFIFNSSTTLAEQVLESTIQPEKRQGQWVHSDELTPGMKILTSDNRTLTVQQGWAQKNNRATTYNFEVANDHTYYVTSHKLWAHNMTDCGKKSRWRRFTDWALRRDSKAITGSPDHAKHLSKLIREKKARILVHVRDKGDYVEVLIRQKNITPEMIVKVRRSIIDFAEKTNVDVRLVPGVEQIIHNGYRAESRLNYILFTDGGRKEIDGFSAEYIKYLLE